MIAREGLMFILGGLVLSILLILGAVRFDSRWLFGIGVVTTLLTLFCVFFFRDPNRSFTPSPGMLISPADGKVVQIIPIDHPHIDGPATQVSIFLNVFDVHVNRVPTDGVVDYVNYNPGKFLAAYDDKASEVNEQTEIGMRSDDGHGVVVKQIAGLIARRIVCRLEPHDTVDIGERFGLIKFGSRTDLIVPHDSRIEVRVGDKVRGAHTVIGYLPQPQPQTNRPAAGVREQHGD